MFNIIMPESAERYSVDGLIYTNLILDEWLINEHTGHYDRFRMRNIVTSQMVDRLTPLQPVIINAHYMSVNDLLEFLILFHHATNHSLQIGFIKSPSYDLDQDTANKIMKLTQFTITDTKTAEIDTTRPTYINIPLIHGPLKKAVSTQAIVASINEANQLGFDGAIIYDVRQILQLSDHESIINTLNQINEGE
jgi:hypothetical protein